MRLRYDERDAVWHLSQGLLQVAQADCNPFAQIPVPFLVGSPNSIGDSVGPEVGTLLRYRRYSGPYLGSMERPIHAGNLPVQIPQAAVAAARYRRRPYIIAVDAGVGQPGWLSLQRGPLLAGEGIRRQQPEAERGAPLPLVGAAHLIASTTPMGQPLDYTRHSLVVGMAGVITAALMVFWERWEAHVMAEYDLTVAAAMAEPG